jgi:IS30 family transposase
MTKNRYYQLTQEQRYKLEAYLNAGKNQSEIALLIGVNKSTISRELKRNVPQRGQGAKIYLGIKAQIKTQLRHQKKYKRLFFSDELKKQMKEWMVIKRYSPELVKAQWIKDGSASVSHETMYKFIWMTKHSNRRCIREYKNLHNFLKHDKRMIKRGNYKDTRGLIPNRVSIEKRPVIVEKRKRFGDIEVDLIMGARHQSALLVTTDRATLITTIDLLEGKDSLTITNLIIKRLKKYPQVKTITFDNDQAFCHHEKIGKALNARTYFTRPYTSQDKGTIENRNGVIRLFFPKKTDFNLFTRKDVAEVEREINNRPVRKFGYLTPNEVFLQKNRVALIG